VGQTAGKLIACLSRRGAGSYFAIAERLTPALDMDQTRTTSETERLEKKEEIDISLHDGSLSISANVRRREKRKAEVYRAGTIVDASSAR
jgi:hypothetical protein